MHWFSKFLQSRLSILEKNTWTNSQTSCLASLLCGWAVNEQITLSLTVARPHSLSELTLAQEVKWNFCIHMDFTLWLTDFVTQRRDSLWQLVKLAIIQFLYQLLLHSRSWGWGWGWGAVVAFPVCQRRGCNTETNNHTLAHKFPIRLTCKSATVGGGLSAWRKSKQEEHTQNGPGLENWAIINSGFIY